MCTSKIALERDIATSITAPNVEMRSPENNKPATAVFLLDLQSATWYYLEKLSPQCLSEIRRKLVGSLGTEFIENESEDVKKQDCETNAAKRLRGRLKEEYPRLPVCAQGDALYAAEPMMRICRENGWKYLFTQKNTRQPGVGESYTWIQEGGGATTVKNIGDEQGTGRYANHVDKVAGKEETIHIYEYEYKKKQREAEKTVRFQWLTNIELTKRNLEEMEPNDQRDRAE